MRRRILPTLAVLLLFGAGCDYLGPAGTVRTAVMGESIAAGAEAELRAEISGQRQIYTLLINHRWISEMQVALPGVIEDPALRILVVQLGVNDTAEKRTNVQMRADIRRFLRTAAPQVECVWWLDIKEDVLTHNPTYDARAPIFNDILRQEAALFPNVHVADYDAWASARPQYMGKDGLHLSGAGRIAFASWVEGTLLNAC